jgi:hypothetical protein
VGAGGEMNQALYAHMNNKRQMRKKKKKAKRISVTSQISAIEILQLTFCCT